MAFYGYMYRSRANLARSINNKSLYELLWLYGIYAALDRFPQNEQVLLMYYVIDLAPALPLASSPTELTIGCPDHLSLITAYFSVQLANSPNPTNWPSSYTRILIWSFSAHLHLERRRS
jgi:hypothetical protein